MGGQLHSIVAPGSGGAIVAAPAGHLCEQDVGQVGTKSRGQAAIQDIYAETLED